jgi:hypothetical protein
VISPINDLETTQTNVLFSFQKGVAVMIDDNPTFTTPTIYPAENNKVISLEPGKYYWKVEGIGESEIRMLTIVSKVDLRLEATDGGYNVINGGNVALDVGIYDNGSLVDNIILNPAESKEATKEKYIGTQSGENGGGK